jgi:hypothetical protein
MSFEPLLILINDMKSEFQTILFGYADIANSAHSPVIGTHASSNEINLNEPEVTNEFSYPDVRVLNTYGYRYLSQLLPKSGQVTYELQATNVLPFKIDEKVRTRNQSKKKPKFRNVTEANKNTRKLRELIKERKSQNVKKPNTKTIKRNVKTISKKRIGRNIECFVRVMERIREMYDESYLDLCLDGLYDLMQLKEAIFRYRINYKQYNLYGKHSYIDEKFSHEKFNEYFVRNDYFVQKFDSIYDKYEEIIEQFNSMFE